MSSKSAKSNRAAWQLRIVRYGLPTLAATALVSATEFADAQSGWKWFGNQPAPQVEAPRPPNGFATAVKRLMEQARKEAAAGQMDAALQTAQRAHKIADAASTVLGDDPSCSPAETRKFLEDLAALQGATSDTALVQTPVITPQTTPAPQLAANAQRIARVSNAAPIAPARTNPTPPSVAVAPRVAPSAVAPPVAPMAVATKREHKPASANSPLIAGRPLPAFVSAPQPARAVLPPSSVGAEVPATGDYDPTTVAAIAAVPRAPSRNPSSVSSRIQPYLSLPEFAIIGGSDRMLTTGSSAEWDLVTEPSWQPTSREVSAVATKPSAVAVNSIPVIDLDSTFITETISISSAPAEDVDALANLNPFDAPPVPGIETSEVLSTEPVDEFPAVVEVDETPATLTSQQAEKTVFPVDNALLQEIQPAASATGEPQSPTPAARPVSKSAEAKKSIIPASIDWESDLTEWSSTTHSKQVTTKQARWGDSAWQPTHSEALSPTTTGDVPRAAETPAPAKSAPEIPEQTSVPLGRRVHQATLPASVETNLSEQGVVTTSFVTNQQPVSIASSKPVAPAPPNLTESAEDDWLNPRAAWVRNVPVTATAEPAQKPRPAATPFDLVQSLATRWNVPVQTVATMLGGCGLLLLGCGLMLFRFVGGRTGS